MRFLVDANLSPRIAEILTAGEHDAVHVRDVGLLTASDEKIMAHAQADSRVIVSADSDFATMLALGGMTVPSLILLRSASHLSPSEQATLLLANLSTVVADLASGSVVSLSTSHLRVRRLPM
jgi:predicted nuclease of predicted toxin-antitoxin system